MVTTNRTGSTTYATPSDLEIVITRVVDAPRRLVWQAWTSPEHLPNWMSGLEGWRMSTCEVDLRPGGAWRYAWSGPDGAGMEMQGSFREVVPPEKLVTTERWGPEWPETVNTLILAERGGQTVITLTVAYPSREARDAALQTGMKEGMDLTFARLDRLLARMEA